MVYVMPHAQVRLWPRSKGDGRFRPRAAASVRATVAYSAVKCGRHTASMSPTISSNLGFTIVGTVLRLGTGVTNRQTGALTVYPNSDLGFAAAAAEHLLIRADLLIQIDMLARLGVRVRFVLKSSRRRQKVV